MTLVDRVNDRSLVDTVLDAVRVLGVGEKTYRRSPFPRRGMLIRNIALRVRVGRYKELRAWLDERVFQQAPVAVPKHLARGPSLNVGLHGVKYATTVNNCIVLGHLFRSRGRGGSD